jgi:hypothetical protein
MDQQTPTNQQTSMDQQSSTSISTMALVQTQPSTLDAIIETHPVMKFVPEICKTCGLCKVAIKMNGKK